MSGSNKDAMEASSTLSPFLKELCNDAAVSSSDLQLTPAMVSEVASLIGKYVSSHLVVLFVSYGA